MMPLPSVLGPEGEEHRSAAVIIAETLKDFLRYFNDPRVSKHGKVRPIVIGGLINGKKPFVSFKVPTDGLRIMYYPQVNELNDISHICGHIVGSYAPILEKTPREAV